MTVRRPTFRPRLEALDERVVPAAGDLDPTFGTGGVVHTTIGGLSSSTADVQVQPDGKIVTVGFVNMSASNGLISDFAITRYNPDGSLDATFGSGGISTISFKSTGQDVAKSVAIQPDGKLVVAGTYSETVKVKSFTYVRSGVALTRLNPNGTLDTTFGTSGRTTSQFSTQTKYGTRVEDVAVQADGKVVVVGWVQQTDGVGYAILDALVARYTPAGALDTGFAAGGKLVWDLGGSESLNDLTIQPDGGIVVAGEKSFEVAQNPSVRRTHALAVRLSPSGQLDTTFGGDQNGNGVRDGYVLQSPFDPASGSNWRAVALQGSSIVLAGFNGGAGNGVTRLTPSGDLDSTFGTDLDGDGDRDGFAVAPSLSWSLGWSSVSDLAVDSQGRLVMAGIAIGPGDPGPNEDYAVVRFTADGAADTTFGTGGVVQYDLDGYIYERIRGIALQPDGKLVAAGDGRDPVTGKGTFTVLRLLGDDPSAAGSIAAASLLDPDDEDDPLTPYVG